MHGAAGTCCLVGCKAGPSSLGYTTLGAVRCVICATVRDASMTEQQNHDEWSVRGGHIQPWGSAREGPGWGRAWEPSPRAGLAAGGKTRSSFAQTFRLPWERREAEPPPTPPPLRPSLLSRWEAASFSSSPSTRALPVFSDAEQEPGSSGNSRGVRSSPEQGPGWCSGSPGGIPEQVGLLPAVKSQPLNLRTTSSSSSNAT